MTLDIRTYLAGVRLGGLAVGPDDQLALGAAVLDRAGTAYETEIRAVDAATGDSRRLVSPAGGVSCAGFTSAGDLLFLAKRDDPQSPKEEKVGDAASLWLLPTAGGEARRVASAPGGIDVVVAARAADVLIAKIEVFPAAGPLADDQAAADAREKAGTSAYLWDSYPIRFWDRHLAPRAPRLFVTDSSAAPLRDLTGSVGLALVEQDYTVTPDGSAVITGWVRETGNGEREFDLVSIDVASGERTVLVSDEGYEVTSPAVSPDGRWLAFRRARLGRGPTPPSAQLWLLDRHSGERRVLAAGLDRWPDHAAFTADSSAVVFDGDDDGAHSVWRVAVDPPDAPAVRLSGAGAFSDVHPSPRGGQVYALRSRIDTPPELVVLDDRTVDQEPRVLHAEGFGVDLPGVVEEVTARAADETRLRAWLVVPAETTSAQPAPLAVFIHGGPLGSWNAWQWRWQPMLLAACGYAVLLPDPALSVGYGQAMVDRGWGQWGGVPYDDVLALTDAAASRPDIDADRTAVLGGSYGGYLTNWTIAHTDRFRCAVTHASVWDMTSMRGVTDDGVDWEREFGHPRRDRENYDRWSPATFADAVVTPTLVIHGERDYRVPVGEGIALYTELQRAGVESQLLYFPDENHWILKPGNIAVWYDAVLAWLDRWVLDADPRRPAHV
jgi:dipeptidyl aminopeptidase/acylaminoacyl peptidase